jgi:hypothetical protein
MAIEECELRSTTKTTWDIEEAYLDPVTIKEELKRGGDGAPKFGRWRHKHSRKHAESHGFSAFPNSTILEKL